MYPDEYPEQDEVIFASGTPPADEETPAPATRPPLWTTHSSLREGK